MKKYAKKLFTFFCLLATVLVGNLAVNWFINTQKVTIEEEILVVGDSHLMTAVDPTYCKNTKVVTQSSEPYLASFLKIQKLTEDNPHIKTVVLGFGYHNLSGYYDDKLLSEESGVIFKNNIQLPLWKHLKTLKYDKRMFFSSMLKHQCLYPQIRSKLYLGKHYATSENMDHTVLEKTIKKHFYRDSTVHLFSHNFNYVYLNKIVEHCKLKNIKLVLACTPTTDAYFNFVPKAFSDEFWRLKHVLSNDNILLFKPANGYSSKCFKDFNHLNSTGAKVFSKRLSNFLGTIHNK